MHPHALSWCRHRTCMRGEGRHGTCYVGAGGRAFCSSVDGHGGRYTLLQHSAGLGVDSARGWCIIDPSTTRHQSQRGTSRNAAPVALLGDRDYNDIHHLQHIARPWLPPCARLPAGVYGGTALRDRVQPYVDSTERGDVKSHYQPMPWVDGAILPNPAPSAT